MLDSTALPLLEELSLAVLGLLVGRIGRLRWSSSVAELLQDAAGSLRSVGEEVTEPSNGAWCDPWKADRAPRQGESG